jgi:hypothetical protein
VGVPLIVLPNRLKPAGSVPAEMRQLYVPSPPLAPRTSVNGVPCGIGETGHADVICSRGDVILIPQVWVCDCCDGGVPESVTFTLTEASPVFADVPLTSPVDGLIVNPCGALTREKVYGGTPPDAATAYVSGLLTPQLTGQADIIVSVGVTAKVEHD